MTQRNGLSFFSALASGLERLTEWEPTTRFPAGSSSASTLTTMVLPTTITVNTTLLRTTFVTITTSVVRSSSAPCSVSISSLCDGNLPPIVSTGRPTSSPTGSTRTLSKAFPLSNTSHRARSSTRTSSATSSAAASSISNAQKHAIIGGLSGAIAGLVLIGVFLCIFLRRRQRREDGSAAGSESGLRETISRNWSQLRSSKALQKPSPPMSSTNAAWGPTPPMSRQSSAADFNGSLLRVSMGHWPRPFANHESFRESAGPGMLRVMNPDDPSGTTSPAPRGSTESGGTYLKRQRSSLPKALFAGHHSRTSSIEPSQRRSAKVPSITIDPALSTECVARTAPTPSFRSYPSVTSLQTVQQRPLEDPFLTPPEGSVEENQPKQQRPGLATLQNAAGAAGRSLGQLGQALNPFRSRGDTAETEPSPRTSATTFSSDGDPFRLDSPSVRESNVISEAEPAHVRPWKLYEGT